MAAISKIVQFMTSDIWKIKLKDLPNIHAFLLRCLRVVILALQGFIRNDCAKNASVLTYYSLLNIVPLLAVMFAIAKGFGLKKLVEKHLVQIADKVNLEPEVTNQLISFADSVLKQAKGGLIAGVGVALLLWTVISIFGKIEDTFNAVWEVKKPRTLVRKVTDYITMMVIAPVMFAVSSSATVFIASELKTIIQESSFLGVFSSIIIFILSLLPYLSIWILLIALYVVMPNVKVPLRSGILAGVTAGTVFQIVQWIYIKFQIGVASHSAIYGSFAAIPLFLGWLQMSWMIVLFGSEIAYANDHFETFGFHPDYSRIGGSSKKLLMLRIFHLLVRKFHHGEKPLNIREIAYKLEIPIRLTKKLLLELVTVGLVVEVAEDPRRGTTFQPARSIEDITIKNVFDMYEQHGSSVPALQSDDVEKFAGYLKDISKAIETSPGNIKLKDI